jgi:transcriptional regulator with XRE-family HTH domain
VPARTPRRTELERVFLRELGERVHGLRRARHRSVEDVCRVTDLRPPALLDLEHGDSTPTALLLYRLAAALQVPVPMLVDPKATPLKVLRLLAAGQP